MDCEKMETCDLHQHTLHCPEADLGSLNLTPQQLQTEIPEKPEVQYFRRDRMIPTERNL